MGQGDRRCENCGRVFGALERGVDRGGHLVCGECAPRLDAEGKSQQPGSDAPRGSADPTSEPTALGRAMLERRGGRRSATIIGLVLALAASALAWPIYSRWRSHRAATGTTHLTLPGWEDLRLGEAPPKDMTCRLDASGLVDSCTGYRTPRNGDLSEADAWRQSQTGVLRVTAALDAEGVAALPRRWGQPERVEQAPPDGVVSVWCSADKREAALLTTTKGMALIVILRANGDMADRTLEILRRDLHAPFPGPLCTRSSRSSAE